jgi:putative hydrolase of the HAD superfamily
MMIEMIAFDADDTLWHNENLFSMTQEKFSQLLAPYHDAEWVAERLYQTEVHNLNYFGYGIKGFTLAMIETAIELTEGRIQGSEIQQIVEFSKEMLRAPIELLDHVAETLIALARAYDLMIITKGDLFDQETKIARSGLADYFKHIEIVSDKTEATYAAILTEYRVAVQGFLMVGNSLKSDILPVIALGGRAIHIPYHVTWAHEIVADDQTVMKPYLELEHIGLLPALIDRL